MRGEKRKEVCLDGSSCPAKNDKERFSWMLSRHSKRSGWYDAHLVLASIVQTTQASSVYTDLDIVLKPLLFMPIAPP